MTVCAAPACTRAPLARALCGGHYARSRRGQSLDAPIFDTIEARFVAKVEFADDGCWLWTAGTRSEGRYGSFSVNDRTRPAHVVAYELFVGPVPEGLEVDHTCAVGLCVNPAHLEAVTHAENVRRSWQRMRFVVASRALGSPAPARPATQPGVLLGASSLSTAPADTNAATVDNCAPISAAGSAPLSGIEWG